MIALPWAQIIVIGKLLLPNGVSELGLVCCEFACNVHLLYVYMFSVGQQYVVCVCVCELNHGFGMSVQLTGLKVSLMVTECTHTHTPR